MITVGPEWVDAAGIREQWRRLLSTRLVMYSVPALRLYCGLPGAERMG